MAIDMFKSHLHQDRYDFPNPFGSINCPGCELSWTSEFVPRYCPECGTKVTDDPAPSNEPFNKKLIMAGWHFSKCPYCKKVIYGDPGEQWLCYCPFCGGDLKLIEKGKHSIRRWLKNLKWLTPGK